MAEVEVKKKIGGSPKFQHYSVFVQQVCANCPHFSVWSKKTTKLVCNRQDKQFVKAIPNKKENRDFAGFDFCPCKKTVI